MLNAEYVWRKNAEYDTFEAHFIPKAECILFKKKKRQSPILMSLVVAGIKL